MGIAGRRGWATRAGFTLVEIVLVVALMLLLVGASVLSLGSLQGGARLEEGAGQMEFLFRYARAEAASRGRRVRIQFGSDPVSTTSMSGGGGTNAPALASPEEGGSIQVGWEPDPLGAPGQFQPLSGATAFRDRLEELVEVRVSPVVETNTFNPEVTGYSPLFQTNSANIANPASGLSVGDALSNTNPPPILFHPDGSSDSADLILVSKDPEDSRRLRLRLTGLTGTVRRAWLPREEDGSVSESSEGNRNEDDGEVRNPDTPSSKP